MLYFVVYFPSSISCIWTLHRCCIHIFIIFFRVYIGLYVLRGGMTIVNGPLDVHGGLTVTSGGVGVTDGFTVAGGGLVVQQGGIQVQ